MTDKKRTAEEVAEELFELSKFKPTGDFISGGENGFIGGASQLLTSWLAEKDERIKELAESLQRLHDIQNGPPLIRYEEEWKLIMAEAEKLLKETKL